MIHRLTLWLIRWEERRWKRWLKKNRVLLAPDRACQRPGVEAEGRVWP